MKTPREVAARAACLGAIEFRCRFEGVAKDGRSPGADAGEMAQAATDWIREAGLWGSLIGPEKALMSLPALGWSTEMLGAIRDASLDESVGVLLFLLHAFDAMPPYHRRFDAERVIRTLPLMRDSPFVTRDGMHPSEEWESMATMVRLLPESAVEHERKIADAWWWRAVSESLVRSKRMQRAKLREVLQDGSGATASLGIPMRGEDFAVENRAYGELLPSEIRTLSMIAGARVRAVRFVVGDVAWNDVLMDS